jgi:tRNA threonylcarbamoyladenosine biosynthesis protein TsaE
MKPASPKGPAGPKRPTKSPAGRGPASDEAEVLFSLSPAETEEIGRRVGTTLRGGELIVLEGDLGMGKTVFMKGLARALDVDPDEVNSPTFVLVAPHSGRLTLYHIDLYRIDSPVEIADLGIEEMLEEGGVVAVEWGEKLPPDLRPGALQVRFTDLGEDSRRLAIRRLPEGVAG